MEIGDLLKDVNNEVTMFAVITRDRAQSHKYLVTDGQVHYGDELLSPADALERFREDHPMFEVCSANVSHRTPEPNGDKSYTWTHIERVDDWVDPRVIRIAELEEELSRLRSELIGK